VLAPDPRTAPGTAYARVTRAATGKRVVVQAPATTPLSTGDRVEYLRAARFVSSATTLRGSCEPGTQIIVRAVKWGPGRVPVWTLSVLPDSAATVLVGAKDRLRAIVVGPLGATLGTLGVDAAGVAESVTVEILTDEAGFLMATPLQGPARALRWFPAGGGAPVEGDAVAGALCAAVCCAPELTHCVSSCADTESDPRNCGECGASCAASVGCLAGRCITCEGPGALDCSSPGACRSGGTCDLQRGCLYVVDAEGAPCDDGDACSRVDACVAGACVGGDRVTCAQAGPCRPAGVCDPGTGACATPTFPDGAACDDGSACTTGDACAQGECVGAAVPCDDANPCTDDACVPASGCTHTPNAAACDDGDACTVEEACAGGRCAGARPADCDDANPCTDETCDPESGCVRANNDLACSDGNVCTVGDRCVGGICVTGFPRPCSDGNACTDDACDPAVGCTHVDNVAPCDDHDACTAGDACAAGACDGAPRTCNDDTPCTDDACDAVLGCLHQTNTADCDDGDACTVGDVCAGGGCAPGPARDCDDADPCTDDGCDAETGCAHVPGTAACDDGDACTFDDSCADGACLGRGGARLRRREPVHGGHVRRGARVPARAGRGPVRRRQRVHAG
jgi:hypothetical protein